MTHLAVVRGLTYTNLGQVFNRWLIPTYGSAFRWTGNQLDSEDLTSWVFVQAAMRLHLPELVQVVDERLIAMSLAAISRHWTDRYGVESARCAQYYTVEATRALDSLLHGLNAEMRLILVLRFLRRRSASVIAEQLRVGAADARRRVIAALAEVAESLGFPAVIQGPPQTTDVSAFVDDLISRRRPIRFEVRPEAWPAMIAATHIQGAIAGNSLPGQRFVRALEQRFLHDDRRLVTEPRIWTRDKGA